MLKPEMYASITVSDKENKQCLSVPSSAVIFDHSQNYVLVFHSKSDVVDHSRDSDQRRRRQDLYRNGRE
jgi:hypothetical protein